MLPHLGSGVGQGFEDVYTLCSLLGDNRTRKCHLDVNWFRFIWPGQQLLSDKILRMSSKLMILSEFHAPIWCKRWALSRAISLIGVALVVERFHRSRSSWEISGHQFGVMTWKKRLNALWREYMDPEESFNLPSIPQVQFILICYVSRQPANILGFYFCVDFKYLVLQLIFSFFYDYIIHNPKVFFTPL